MAATTSHESLALALESLKKHEIDTNSRYAVLKVTKDFGKGDFKRRVKQVMFTEKCSVNTGRQTFSGVPFAIIGRKTFECQFGKDRKEKKKKKLRDVKDQDHCYGRGKKFLAQPSKKLGCPAMVVIREIMRFPDHKANESTTNDRKKELCDDILCRISRDYDLSFCVEYVLCLPLPESHEIHPVHEVSLTQMVDPMVSAKIHSLAREGVVNVEDVKLRLQCLIRDEFKTLPHPSNKRFYPSKKIIQNHLYQALAKEKNEGDPQILLYEWITERRRGNPEDFLYYRTKSIDDSFLLIYQSADMKRLLGRYGNFILMDSTYKTCMFNLPVFFVLVKTNVNYQIVATFMIENEIANNIGEALQKIHEENPAWNPSYFITDFDEAEIRGIETVFSDTKVLLCDFHREQAWLRWLKRAENGIKNPQEILVILRTLASAESTTEFDNIVLEIENVNLLQYLQKVWFPVKERWCHAYRFGKVDIKAHTTNPVESTHKHLKQEFLKGKTNHTLPDLVKILIENFLPEKYKRYCEQNNKLRSAYRKYSRDIPAFLHDRPHDFIKHCLSRIESSRSIQRHQISENDGTWIVQGNSQTYKVNLGTQDSFPSCECWDWKKCTRPCKHMFAVMQDDGQIDWGLLSQKYRQSPFFVLDKDIFSNMDDNESVLVDGIFDWPTSFEGLNEPQSLPEDFSVDDYPNLCETVEMIWNNQKEIDPCNVGPFTLTTNSIHCVNTLLSDEVIDAFLHHLVQQHQRSKHIDCITMTAIFEGIEEIHHNLRRLPCLLNYDLLIGAYNQGRCHWCLIIILTKERRIIYINPLGNKDIHEQNIVLRWFNFLKARFDSGIESMLPEKWTIETPPHAQQFDGSSCGIYVLKFAENYLAGRPLVFTWSKEKLKNARLSLATFLLSASNPQEIHVPQLGSTDSNKTYFKKTECQDRKQTEKVASPVTVGHPKRNRKKRRLSSFVYRTPKVQKRVYCVCQKSDDGSLYWQCEKCNGWFHPACIGQKDDEEPEVFMCPSCKEQGNQDKTEENDVSMEEIKSLSRLENLSGKHIHFLFQRNKHFLQKVMQGEVHCTRHDDYQKGGISRSNLDHASRIGKFTDEQIDMVMDYLVSAFCKDNRKNLDYILRVLLPVFLIRIHMAQNGTTEEESERLLTV